MRLKSRLFLFVFFNDTATTEIYTLSLHDALPISCSHNPVFLLHYNPPADWRLPLMRNRRGLHPLLQKEAEPMMKPSSGLANKVIERILELSADAHIQRRGTAKDSPAFHKLTGAIAAYGKALALLAALQRRCKIVTG